MNEFELKDIRPKASEHNEQASFFDWLYSFKASQHPEVTSLFFAVSNGSYLAGNEIQRAKQMIKLKKEGFTPGVADTLFLSGRGGYLGLALEFKTEERKKARDGGVSAMQRDFLDAVREEGYKAEVAYGVDHAVEIASEYFAMPKTQQMIYQALRQAEKGDLVGCLKLLQEVTLTW